MCYGVIGVGNGCAEGVRHRQGVAVGVVGIACLIPVFINAANGAPQGVVLRPLDVAQGVGDLDRLVILVVLVLDLVALPVGVGGDIAHAVIRIGGGVTQPVDRFYRAVVGVVGALTRHLAVLRGLYHVAHRVVEILRDNIHPVLYRLGAAHGVVGVGGYIPVLVGGGGGAAALVIRGCYRAAVGVGGHGTLVILVIGVAGGVAQRVGYAGGEAVTAVGTRRNRPLVFIGSPWFNT